MNSPRQGSYFPLNSLRFFCFVPSFLLRFQVIKRVLWKFEKPQTSEKIGASHLLSTKTVERGLQWLFWFFNLVDDPNELLRRWNEVQEAGEFQGLPYYYRRLGLI
jgi:hypothetical protein